MSFDCELGALGAEELPCAHDAQITTQPGQNGARSDGEAEAVYAVHKARNPFTGEPVNDCSYQKVAFFKPANGAPAWIEEPDPAKGLWTKPEASPFAKYNFVYRFVVRDLEARFMLRQQAAKRADRAALVTGILASAHRDGMRPATSTPMVEHVTSDPIERNGRTFIDGPRAWITFDFEGLTVSSFDAVEQPEDVISVFQEQMEALGLDWLICDCVISLSSAYGLVNRNELRFHVDLLLERPLKLAEQKRVAEYINAKAGRKVVDLGVYNSDRLLFTGAPKHLQTVLRGADIVEERATSPVRGERVLLVNNTGQQRLRVPDEALAQRSPSRANGATGNVSLFPWAPAGKGPNYYLNQLANGHFIDPLKQATMSYAAVTPEHRWNAEEWRARMLSAVTAKGLDPDKDSDRKRHLSLEWIEKQFALFRKNKLVPGRTVNAEKAPESLPIADARRAVKAVVQHAVNEAVRKQEEGRTDEPAQATLIKVPPGVGKTHAVSSALHASILAQHRIIYTSPTIKLSEEYAERHRKVIEPQCEPRDPDADPSEPTVTELLVRQKKGRQKLCKDKAHGALAERVEKAGRSPLELVCPKCPLFKTCKFPKQFSDKGSGLVAMQHAHVTTSLMRVKPNSENAPTLSIFDESLFGTLIAGDDSETRYAAAALKADGEYGLVRQRRGQKTKGAAITPVRLGETADFKAVRDKVCEVITAAEGPLRRSELAWFEERIGVATFDNQTHYSRRSRLAFDAENAHQAWLSGEFKKAVEEQLEAIEAGDDVSEIDQRVKKISDAINASRFVVNVLRAIDTSLDIAARDEVLGIFRYQKDGQPWVRCRLRKPLPAVLTHKDSLSLDGTADLELFKVMFRRAKVDVKCYDWPVKPGSYHSTQFADKSFSKRMLTEAKGKKNDCNLRKMHRFVLAKAYDPSLRGRAHSCQVDGVKKDVLVVVQLPVEKRLTALGLPDNVVIKHFNELRGLDAYRDIPCAIIAGRPEPRVETSEELAEAWFYDDPSVISLSRVAQSRKTRWREGRQIECEAHPDPHVEMIRRQVVNAEVQQAVARLRIYDRTHANRAEIYVFGDVDTGLPVHELRRWKDAEYDLPEVQLAAGVVFARAETVAAAYPSLLPEDRREREKAVAHAWQRATKYAECATNYREGGGIPMKYIQRDFPTFGAGLSPSLCCGVFRVKGHRARKQQVLINTSHHRDPVAAIAGLLRLTTEQIDWLGWNGTTPPHPSRRKNKGGRPRAANPSAAALRKRAQRERAAAKAAAPTAAMDQPQPRKATCMQQQKAPADLPKLRLPFYGPVSRGAGTASLRPISLFADGRERRSHRLSDPRRQSPRLCSPSS
jgi:hypothetical protein